MSFANILIYFGIPLAFIIAGYFFVRLRKKGYFIYNGVKVPKEFPFIYYTPLGVKVFSVTQLPSEALTKIDEGISQQIECINTYKPDWFGYNTHSSYTIKLVDPMIITASGLPSLVINGINSAGTVMGVGNDGQAGVSILLPHQTYQNWNLLEYFRTSVWYESEHAREWVNDRITFYHFTGDNDIHPHFPCPATKPGDTTFPCGVI